LIFVRTVELTKTGVSKTETEQLHLAVMMIIIIILSRVGVTVDRVLDRMMGFIDTLFTQIGTTGDTALSLSTHVTVHCYTYAWVLSLH
jgi:hypothetical protein